MAAQVSLESLLQTFDIDIQLLGKNFNVYNYIHTTICYSKCHIFYLLCEKISNGTEGMCGGCRKISMGKYFNRQTMPYSLLVGECQNTLYCLHTKT